MRRYFSKTVLLVGALILAHVCGAFISLKAWSFFSDPKPTRFILENTKPLEPIRIEPSGGSLTISDAQSPFYGVTLTFPPGAVAQKTACMIYGNKGRFVDTPPGQAYADGALSIRCQEGQRIDQPLSVSVPIPPALQKNWVPVPFAVQVDESPTCQSTLCRKGTLQPLQLVRMDREAGRFVFQTFVVPSVMTWIYAPLEGP